MDGTYIVNFDMSMPLSLQVRISDDFPHDICSSCEFKKYINKKKIVKSSIRNPL